MAKYVSDLIHSFRMIPDPIAGDKAPHYQPLVPWIEIGGLEGSGKTTQALLLQHNLQGALTCFPNYGSWSGKTLLVMRQHGAHKTHVMAYHHLLAFNAHECLPLPEEVASGSVIISDGAWADQSLKAKLDGIKDPSLLRSFRYGLPIPALSIYLLDQHTHVQDPLTQERLKRAYKALAGHTKMICLRAPSRAKAYSSANALQERILSIINTRGILPQPLPMSTLYNAAFVPVLKGQRCVWEEIPHGTSAHP